MLSYWHPISAHSRRNDMNNVSITDLISISINANYNHLKSCAAKTLTYEKGKKHNCSDK